MGATIIKRYFWNLLIAIDQLGNAICGGDPDETISSRLGKWQRDKRTGWRAVIMKVLCPILNWLDPNHCEDSIEHDEGDDATLH